MNRNGFTFLTAIFMVMIIGIMLGMTGQSWKTIMKREREKELLFRGSQIKEAIENWNNLNYTVPGVAKRTRVHPLNDLKDLLQDPYTLTPLRYLPHNYAAAVDDKNPKCGSECAKLKVYQDPMTGKEWTIIRGSVVNGIVTPNQIGGNAGNAGVGQALTISTGIQGAGIIGVASKSDEEPLKTDFKGTALENMGVASVGTTTAIVSTVSPFIGAGTPATAPGLGGKMTKYSEWKFVAEPSTINDHSKIYRAYHERW